jgi:hypothetical protein
LPDASNLESARQLSRHLRLAAPARSCQEPDDRRGLKDQ